MRPGEKHEDHKSHDHHATVEHRPRRDALRFPLSSADLFLAHEIPEGCED
jgi:hypothetical protein